MGFTPVDMGSLASAREVEAMPLRLLPGWKVPALLALGLFVFFYTYNFIRDVLQPYLQEGKNKFYQLPVSVVNTTLPCVAYVLLSLVYLPGVVAAALQLRRGTKYRRFPDWLGHWLQHRKQIGLLSFFCAALHALYSFCLPLRRSHRYELVNLAVKQVRRSPASRQSQGRGCPWVQPAGCHRPILPGLGPAHILLSEVGRISEQNMESPMLPSQGDVKRSCELQRVVRCSGGKSSRGGGGVQY